MFHICPASQIEMSKYRRPFCALSRVGTTPMSSRGGDTSLDRNGQRGKLDYDIQWLARWQLGSYLPPASKAMQTRKESENRSERRSIGATEMHSRWPPRSKPLTSCHAKSSFLKAVDHALFGEREPPFQAKLPTVATPTYLAEFTPVER
jgi:hypothetical protein